MDNSEGRSHITNVLNAVEGNASGEVPDDWLQQSWQRSVERYRLDPARAGSRRVLTASELREASDRLSGFLDVAKPHIDELDRHVSAANYCILLTDAYGSTIDYRKGNDADSRFRDAGVCVGICWSEQEEGTNGVGTTIINQKPTLVHKTDHFRADNIALSCSAAPVFSVDDELVAVLDASTLYSPYNRDSQALVFHLVNEKALQIENAYAERSLRQQWRLSVSPRIDHHTPETDWLISFNENGEITGANRPAKRHLLGDSGPQHPTCIDDLFGCSAEGLLANAHAAPGLALPLRVSATGRLVYAVLRAPARTQPAAHQPAPAAAPVSAAGQPPDAFGHLATGDKRLKDIVAKACRLANGNIPVMLLGETGTGKEAFAKSLHNYSARRAQPFVALNCAAIPETLIESELFGYRDGAFTGAKSRGSKGKIMQADGGTLFLDEIGDMPLLLQSRLLRVLAEGEVLPLGAEEPTRVHLHVVCATHQALDELIRAGRFREDLYYRLSGAVFQLPALRDRDDIGDVIKRLLREEGATLGRPWMEIDRDAMQLLKAHPWPGNIRQLRHVLRYACTISDTERLSMQSLPAEFVAQAPRPVAPTQAAVSAVHAVAAVHAEANLQRVEAASAHAETADVPTTPGDQPLRERMLAALKRNQWHVTFAARELGMPRSTFYRQMTKLRIVSPNQA